MTILCIVLPLSIIPFSLPVEMVSLSMAFALLPLPYIQISRVKEALALAISQVVLPVAQVLVVAALLLV